MGTRCVREHLDVGAAQFHRACHSEVSRAGTLRTITTSWEQLSRATALSCELFSLIFLLGQSSESKVSVTRVGTSHGLFPRKWPHFQVQWPEWRVRNHS